MRPITPHPERALSPKSRPATPTRSPKSRSTPALSPKSRFAPASRPRLSKPLFLAAVTVLALTSVAGAQPRRSELGVELPFAGVARRDLGYVATRDPIRPGFGLDLRVLGRVAHAEPFELHLGARLAATAWRTDTLRRTEGAFRTTFDPGLVLRGARGPFALALTFGPTFALPAIAELFSGVRTARGAHVDLALGLDHALGRLRLGLELAYAHHRLRASTPAALTTTHVLALRLRLGITPKPAPAPDP